jgi:hypothetical protein
MKFKYKIIIASILLILGLTMLIFKYNPTPNLKLNISDIRLK